MAIKAARIFREAYQKYKQIRGSFFEYNPNHGMMDPNLGACANGVLIHAVTGGTCYEDALKHLPCLLRQAPNCPVCHLRGVDLPDCGVPSTNWIGRLSNLIAHLNDDHEWTFEQILAFLDSLPEEDPASCNVDSNRDLGGNG